MARGGGEYNGGGGVLLSYKRITLLVCLINILIALFVLRFLYASSLHIFPNHDNGALKKRKTLLSCLTISFVSKACVFFNVFYLGVKYTADEIRRMEESVRIRRSKEPVELVRLVSGF